MTARIALTLALSALCPLAVLAQLLPPPKNPLPPPALKVGDAAPPLKGEGWYGTEKVPAFEKGKVYVVTFWYVDNGFGNSNVVRLSNICGNFKDVTPIAVTRAPTDKSKIALKQYTDFLDTYHAPIKLTFVNDPTAAIWRAYEGVRNEPNSFVFVIGKDGKIAYIATDPGTIENVPDVLPKVLDGKWKGKEDVAKIAEADDAYAAIWDKLRKPLVDVDKQFAEAVKKEKDEIAPGLRRRETVGKAAAVALKDLDAFAKAHPERAKRNLFQLDKLLFALWAEQKEPAIQALDALCESAKPQESLRGIGKAGMLTYEQFHMGYGLKDAVYNDVVSKLATATLTVEGKSVAMQEDMYEIAKYIGRVKGRTTSVHMMKEHLKRYPGQEQTKEQIIVNLEADAETWRPKIKAVMDRRKKEVELEKEKGKDK